MQQNWSLYLVLTLAAIFVQAFFAMSEMALVSFNKLRLQYYVSKGSLRAKWISKMLKSPSLLFGTTLIGVNTAMQVGSECSRRFYEAIGIKPDWAPITQVLIVIIFAEISPMFAGRKYPEHVAMLNIPILFFFSIILRPFVWIVDRLLYGLSWLFKGKKNASIEVTRDELQKVFVEREEKRGKKGKTEHEIQSIAANIFRLKNLSIVELMQPLATVKLVAKESMVKDLKILLRFGFATYVPVYQKMPQNIIGVVNASDVMAVSGQETLLSLIKQPLFVTETISILELLEQFQKSEQKVAIVINEMGLAIGTIALAEIVQQILGKKDFWVALDSPSSKEPSVIIDRIFSSHLEIAKFNERYKASLPLDYGNSLQELIIGVLGHRPAKDERVEIHGFEFIVIESPLLGDFQIHIKTLSP